MKTACARSLRLDDIGRRAHTASVVQTLQVTNHKTSPKSSPSSSDTISLVGQKCPHCSLRPENQPRSILVYIDDEADRLAREIDELRQYRAALGALSRRFLTAGEVAARLRVKPGWVYRHARELGAERFGAGRGGDLRFTEGAIESYLDKRRGRR